MTKKTRKKATQQADSPVQFRAGTLLADLLATLSDRWQVSKNEAARRLTSLAIYELDARHHDLVFDVARAMMGDRDYSEACERVYVELQAVNRSRHEHGQLPMTEDERQERIQGVIRLVQYGLPTNEEEEEKKKLYVQQVRQ